MKLIGVLILVMMIGVIQAELYHDQRPMYADDDFMKPTEMIALEQLEIFQILVIAAMLSVIVLKLFGTYLMLRYSDKTIKFNPAFVVSGLLGVFVGYVGYMGTNPALDATYVDIFIYAGFYALGTNLMFDFAGKVKERLS